MCVVEDLKIRSHEDEEYVGRFTCMLICSEGMCEQPVGVIGEIFYEPEPDPDSVAYVERFRPRFVSPPPDIFPVPPKCPLPVRHALRSAFELYWANSDAAAGQLRMAIERLIKEIDESLQGSLHSRIEQLRQTRPEIAEALLAVKWIGNAGAHEGSILALDLDDGLDVMSHVLAELYIGRDRHRREIIAQINEAEQPRSRGGKASGDLPWD